MCRANDLRQFSRPLLVNCHLNRSPARSPRTFSLGKFGNTTISASLKALSYFATDSRRRPPVLGSKTEAMISAFVNVTKRCQNLNALSPRVGDVVDDNPAARGSIGNILGNHVILNIFSLALSFAITSADVFPVASFSFEMPLARMNRLVSFHSPFQSFEFGNSRDNLLRLYAKLTRHAK